MNKEERNKIKRDKMRIKRELERIKNPNYKKCVICMKKFISTNGKNVCSEECRKLRWKEYSKKFYKNNKDKYLIGGEYQKKQKIYRTIPEVKERLDYYRKKYLKKYIQTKTGKEVYKRKKEKYEKANWEKIIAQRKAQKIIIPKDQLCEICKIEKAVERHHEDYSKPLKVKFLCVRCHKELHRRLI